MVVLAAKPAQEWSMARKGITDLCELGGFFRRFGHDAVLAAIPERFDDKERLPLDHELAEIVGCEQHEPLLLPPNHDPWDRGHDSRYSKATEEEVAHSEPCQSANARALVRGLHSGATFESAWWPRA